MIVVADASPLVALAICECLHVLEKLFREIKVAQAVYDEVTVPGKPKCDILENYLNGKTINIDLDRLVIEGISLGMHSRKDGFYLANPNAFPG